MSVYRKPATQQRWGKLLADRLYIEAEPAIKSKKTQIVTISFCTPVSDERSSFAEYKIELPALDYEALAQSMMNADPVNATRAFGAALMRGQISTEE